MIVNKGFSFNNMVGQYRIKEMRFPVRNTYGTEPCIVCIYPGRLKPIYSRNSYEEGSIAFEFASIDVEDESAILAFCYKYGLLFCNKVESNVTNDYMFFRTQKTNFTEVVPTTEPEQLFLSTFIREVITMRNFLYLKSSLDEKNLIGIVSGIIKMILTFTDRTHVPSNTETERFNRFFYLYVKHKYRFASEQMGAANFMENDVFDIQSAVNAFLDDLEYYVHAEDEFVRDAYFGNVLKLDDMFHSTWQGFHTLLSRLMVVTTIQTPDQGETILFDPPLTLEMLSEAEITFDSVRNVANACISDIMNSQTSAITPELRYEDGSLTADWHISSLLEAMYMELQVSFTPNIQIKKCANPTCNYFFEIGKENHKRIYCSQRCALLMAKRKQRERERNKRK